MRCSIRAVVISLFRLRLPERYLAQDSHFMNGVVALTAVLPFWKKNILHSGKGETCTKLNSFVFFLFVEFAPKGALRFLPLKRGNRTGEE
jgi:hypothetical protein